MNRRPLWTPSIARRRRPWATVLMVVVLGLIGSVWAAWPASAEQPGSVWVTRVSGIIHAATADYLVKTINSAADAQAAALVVELDTPGGFDISMRKIVQAQLDSPIPVVFYVSPQGARAASAGVFLLMAADVAAMAPQTNLGSATPVAFAGDMDETMRAKVVNDAAAYIKALAKAHGRNAAWAEQAVREAVSLPADEALAQNVVDFVAPDLAALLSAIHGYTTVPKGLTLTTTGAPIHEVSMGWTQRVLNAIADPNIAYVLLVVGALGIIIEILTPGFGIAGVTGAIALLLAFYSFQVLPVNLVGIALVVLAMILFVAEVKVQSSGVLGVGGVAALIAGGLFLYDATEAFLRVSWPVLVIAAVVALGFFLLVARSTLAAKRRPHATGLESMTGAAGVVLSPLEPEGLVRVRGEIWKARAEDGPLHKDEEIGVVGAEGLTLIVRRRKEGQ